MGRGLAVRGAAEVLALGLVAATSILISRAIGPEQFGRYAFTWATVQLATMLVGLGTSTAGAQRVANDAASSKRTYAAVVGGRLLTAAVVGLLAGFVLFLAPLDGDLKTMAAIGGIAVVAHPLRAEWLFVGLGRPGFLASMRILSTAAAFVVAVALIHTPADAPISTITLAAQALVFATISTASAIRVLNLRSIHLKISDSWSILRSGASYLRNEIAVYVYTSSDRLFLFVFATPSVLGLYDAAYRLIQPMYAISAVVGDTKYAELARAHATSRAREVFRHYVDLMSAATIPFGFFCAVAADWIIALAYGDRFAGASTYLRLLGWVITLGYIAGMAILPMGAWNRPREYARGATAGGLADLILNIVLIPPFAGVGAAIATIGANVVTVIAGIRNLRRVSTYPFVRHVVGYVAASAVAAGSLLLFTRWFSEEVGVATFVLVYVGLAPLTRRWISRGLFAFRRGRDPRLPADST